MLNVGRVAIWIVGAFVSGLPIYVIVSPTFGTLGNLLEFDKYQDAAKAIFFFYFSLTIAAFLYMFESAILNKYSDGWRSLIAILAILYLVQTIVFLLYSRDIYFDRDTVSSAFCVNLFLWAIIQSFASRLVVFVPRLKDDR